MTITAKFASVCPCCNQRIELGSKVEWTKGSKARHVSCSAHPGATVTPREDGSARRRRAYRYGWDGVEGSSSYYTSGLYDEES